MSFEDITRQFEQWRRMTDLSGLARELERQRQLMEPVLRDLAQQQQLMEPVLKDLAQQRELMEPVFAELGRDFVERQLLASSLEEQFAATRELVHGLGSWAETLHRQVVEASELQTRFRSMVEVSAGPAFEFIATHFRRAVVDAEHFAEFRQTFAAELLDYLGRLQTADTDHETSETFEELSEFFEQTLEELPKSEVSLQGFLQIFLAIVFFVWTNLAGLKSENIITQGLASLEERISVEREEVRPEDIGPPMYVVTKAVRLRQGPSTKDAILAILQPNMVIEVHETEGQWLFVEYFDYVDATLKDGWVFKKYLKPLDLVERGKASLEGLGTHHDLGRAADPLVSKKENEPEPEQQGKKGGEPLELGNAEDLAMEIYARGDPDLLSQCRLYIAAESERRVSKVIAALRGLLASVDLTVEPAERSRK